MLSPSSWIIVGLSSLSIALGGLTVVQTKRLEGCQTESAHFEGAVAALGKAAEERTAQINAENKRKKVRTDEAVKSAVAAAVADAARLRDDVASRGVVPGAPAGSSDPARACYERSELDGILRDFAGEAAGLVGRGGKAESALNELKRSK